MNGFKPGDHVCALYDTLEEQIAVATAYVADGLSRGERCLYVADSPTALYMFCESLDRAGVDSRSAVVPQIVVLAVLAMVIDVALGTIYILAGNRMAQAMTRARTRLWVDRSIGAIYLAIAAAILADMFY